MWRSTKKKKREREKEREKEGGLLICIPRAGPLINIGRRTPVGRGEGANGTFEKWHT